MAVKWLIAIADRHRMEARVPWFARLVGGVLAAIGLIISVGVVVHPPSSLDAMRPLEDGLLILATILALAGGIGILLSRTWGWALAVGAIALAVLIGFVEFLRQPPPLIPGGQRDELDFTGLSMMALPSIGMLAALLAPQTMNWPRHSQRSP